MSEAQKALALIQKDFRLEEPSNNLASSSLEEVLKYLEQVISYLLDNDFERLLQIMYRIDIDENRFKQVIHDDKPGEIARKLARLVLDRELSKVRSRARYRGSNGS